MKKVVNIKILILFFFLKFNYSNSAIQEKIIVHVQDEIITSYDIENEIRTLLILADQDISQENINNTKKIALNNLINLKLKEIETSKYKIRLKDNAVPEYLLRITSNNVPSFKEKFDLNDLNYEIYLKKIESELKWQSLIFSKYKKNVKIQDQEIENELKKILDLEGSVEEFNLKQIEVLFEKTTKEKIDKLKNVIRNLNFEEVLKILRVNYINVFESDIGWVSGNIISKDIYNIVKTLELGERSEVILKTKSVLILKLVDKRNSKKENLNIDELKKNLINKKQNELFTLYSNSYLSKIKNNYSIRFK